MPFFHSDSASTQLPASRRISSPASQRLTTITEGLHPPSTPPIPPRSILRNAWYNSHANRWSVGAGSQNTTRSARPGPPAYDWVPEPLDGDDDGNAPVEGEKLAELRRRGLKPKKTRGGWGRSALIVIVLLLVAIALGVGLGVGLTSQKRNSSNNNNNNNSSQGPSSASTSAPLQQFPLGVYSLITVLRTANTNCTSNAATWRCYPYSVFDSSDSSTEQSSVAAFNWIITNTSSIYPSNATSTSTSDQGIPANLTISSTNNPFSISFANQSLTYIASSGNATSARYTFDFPMPKSVIPAVPLTDNDATTLCFFNQSSFTGTLYLTAPATYPDPATADASGIGGGDTPWPYAVEVSQTSPGGEGIPACYVTTNGVVGAPLPNGPSPEAADTQCSCDYRNY